MKTTTEDLYLSPEEIKKYKIKMGIFRGIMYALMTIVALFILFPFYYMIITSFKSMDEIRTGTVSLLPKDWTFENYATVFSTNVRGINEADTFNIFTLYKNTMIVSTFSTIGVVITTVLMAFAFSRLNFKGRDLIFSMLLMTMMIPGEIYVVTNYQTMTSSAFTGQALNIEFPYLVLILPFMTSVFYTFFLRQSFKQIPNELYLAAKVDGLGDFKYLFKVMIPIAKSTVITIIILSMIGSWNSYIWPSLITREGKYSLISNGLIRLFSALSGEGPDLTIGYKLAASTLITIPLLIVFIVLRKYIMSGVGRSGIKG